MLNISAIGNLGQDAEQKETPNGYSYVKLSVAAKSHKNDDTAWLNCSWFGKEASACLPRLTKGTQVYVEGRYKVRTFQTHAGQDRISHDLDVQNLVVLSGTQRTEDEDENERLPF